MRGAYHIHSIRKKKKGTLLYKATPVLQSCATEGLNKTKYNHIILYSKGKVNQNITRLKVTAKTIKESLEDAHGKVVYKSDSPKGKVIEFDSPQKQVVRYRVQARYVASPFAEDADDAIEQGKYKLAETSFGELKIEDSEAIYVKNSDRDFVWKAD